jgi:hypothetical protein
MDPSQWLASFRITHENYKRGILNEGDQRKYMSMRDELARSIMQSQGLTVPAGVRPGRAFNVAYVYQIEIGGVARTTTQKISCVEFTSLVSGSFKLGERVTFSLTLSRSQDPLAGVANVKSTTREKANATRLTCEFEGLGEERLARLETALFDAALSRF